MSCARFILVALSMVFATLLADVSVGAAADESVCIQCHGGLDGHLAEPIDDWSKSIHARNGVSCHDCHGGDPSDFAMAMSPERGFLGVPDYEAVPEFCGRCHIGVEKDYRSSAHGQALAEGGAQCVICHGNHAVEEAQIGLINEESCTRCHDYGRAAEIKLALKDTDARIMTLEGELERIHKLGFATEKFEGSLFDLRNGFRSIFHSVEVERVRQETGNIGAELGKMEDRVKEYDAEIGKRTLWGSVVMALFILLGAVFWVMRKTYADEEKS